MGGRRIRRVQLIAVTVVAVAAAPAWSNPGDSGGVGTPSPTGRRARPPVVKHLEAPERVARFTRFEVTARIRPRPQNPFDPAQLDLVAVLRDPQGHEHRVVGFYYQGYVRTLVGGTEELRRRGPPAWKVRFAPPTPGRWTWWLEVRSPGGSTTTPARTLEVDEGDSRGYVRRSRADVRYLAFDDGSPYFAIGENLGWYDARGTFAYDHWYDQLARQGATYSRLWMASWSFGLEWTETPLGDYRERLDRAWQLDHVIEEGERRGIYAVLSLLNHGAFSTRINPEWAANPYNAVNGGPLASPSQFFTDATARELFRRRLRYIVARWGYSTNILAWELWNEAEFVDGYDSTASVTWHRDMADELRRLDPADHLVTTSFAVFVNDPQVWSQAGLDYTQLHLYSRVSLGGTVIDIFTNLAQHVTTWSRDRIRDYQRPVLFGELGVDARGPAETMQSDPNGIGVHDGLWAGAVSGGFGTAMTWWWDNLIDVEPDRYYPMFDSLARFVTGIHWDREGFGPVTGSVTSPSRPLVLYGLEGERVVLLWIKDDAYQWNSPAPVAVTDATLVPVADGEAAGRWCGQWWDTWRGEPVGAVEVAGGGTSPPLAVPSFTGDIALRLERC